VLFLLQFECRIIATELSGHAPLTAAAVAVRRQRKSGAGHRRARSNVKRRRYALFIVATD